MHYSRTSCAPIFLSSPSSKARDSWRRKTPTYPTPARPIVECAHERAFEFKSLVGRPVAMTVAFARPGPWISLACARPEKYFRGTRKTQRAARDLSNKHIKVENSTLWFSASCVQSLVVRATNARGFPRRHLPRDGRDGTAQTGHG